MCIADGESPSVGSSASWRDQKTPFFSLCHHLHYCQLPVRHTCKVWCQFQSTKWNKSNISDSTTDIILPFKAIALLSSFVKVGLEAKRSFWLFALSFGLSAECSRPLQLGSYDFGITTVVAGSRTVWNLVPKELGDGSVATAGGKTWEKLSGQDSDAAPEGWARWQNKCKKVWDWLKIWVCT